MPDLTPPIILSLDFEEKIDALDVLKRIGSRLRWVKVGFQMYLKYGPSLLEELSDKGYRIFLDLKLFDIPNTVSGAIQSIGRLPVEMLTLHTLGSSEMIKAAKTARDRYAPELKLIGATMLTSMNTEQMSRIGIAGEIPGQVLRLAQLACTHGLDGVVCSPKELVVLKTNIEKDWIYVTPGIRPESGRPDDHNRVATPTEAIQKGANYLVVGRPITASENPEQVLNSMLTEIQF
jgi:orotidine-5'-phosphate decarboxylase